MAIPQSTINAEFMLTTSCCPKEGIAQRDLGPGLKKNGAPNERGKKIKAGNIQQIVRLWWGMIHGYWYSHNHGDVIVEEQSNWGYNQQQCKHIVHYRKTWDLSVTVTKQWESDGISHQFIVKLKNTVLEVGTAATVLNGHPAKLQRPQFLELRFLRWNSEPSWVQCFFPMVFPQKSGDVPIKQSDCIKL